LLGKRASLAVQDNGRCDLEERQVVASQLCASQQKHAAWRPIRFSRRFVDERYELFVQCIEIAAWIVV
jgi:hypothetical protein